MARVLSTTFLGHSFFPLVKRRTLIRQVPEPPPLFASSNYSSWSKELSPLRFPQTNGYIPSQQSECSEEEDVSEDAECEKWRRPEVFPYRREALNVACLTGVVTHGVNLFRFHSGKCKVEVSLLVHSSSTRNDRFCVEFWDQLAEIAATHVKESDQIYVLGRLSLELYLAKDNVQKTVYKVIGSDFKFVEGFPPEYKCKHLSPKSQERQLLSTKLWQSYFENPSEWWDNRTIKRNPRAPDFRHKKTQEVLWINGQTPVWVLSKFKTLAPGSNLQKSSHEDEDLRFPSPPPIS